MKDEDKTKEQLINELAELRQRVTKFEELETKLKKTKDKLEHQKKHLESLIKYSSLAIVTLDEGQIIISCNRDFEKLFQFEESEIIGKNLDELIAGQKYLEDAVSYTKEALSGKAIHGYGERKRKDGIYIDVEFFGVPVVIDGKLVGAYGIYQDISERKQAEELFRTLFDRSPVGLFIIQDRKFKLINPQFLQLTGYKEDEFLDTDSLAFILPEDRNMVMENTIKMLKGKLFLPFEFRVINKSGETRWIEQTITSIQYQTRPAVLGYYVDITERKQAEDALEQSEERYRDLVENSFDGIFIQKGPKIIFTNQRLNKMLGYEIGELLGLDHWLVYHPDYQELTRKRALARMQGEKIPPQYEVKLQRKDGSWFYGEINARVISFEEGPGIQVWVRDISEHKQAEEELRDSEKRLKTILDSIQAGIVLINVETHTIVDANPAAIKMIGAPKEEIIDHVCHKFICSAEKGKCPITDLGQEIDNSERILFTATGEEVPILKTVTPILLNGQAHLLESFFDITEKKKLEAQLQQAQKMEAIGTLAGGIAHDFNNMLQAISGYTQILLMGKKASDPDYEKLEAIEKSAQRASDLTKRLLIFSRKVESKLRPVGLNQEIEQVSKMLERTIPKMINIELHLAENLKIINADPAQIEQIMMNLGVNARDAMPDGGRLIFETENVILDEQYCKIHLGARPGKYVKLSISDTGHGMDREILSHIFEPFYTTKETGKGTGLGLAMVYGIVKNHDGYIMCYSEPGEGTTFKIYFPIIEKEIKTMESKEEKVPIKGGSETILLVDDEEAIRELGEDIFTRFGYTVLMASDGESALEIYSEKKEEINLVILDIIMPGIGGRRCLEKLLKMNPRVKVIIASGYSINGPTKEVLEAGAKGFISKPYDMRGMLKTVRKILDED
ncbi:MAG: PAS domain S-box protein [Desulfobacteraceae bacterium]|nr:MAG: PAS domain S-box protein [Desulfobacteraceae bacterium]